MKDLLSATLMTSIVAVQPKEHMVSEAHSASSMGTCSQSSCSSQCDGSCKGNCTGSCQRNSR
jgi:hypothetical protein